MKRLNKIIDRISSRKLVKKLLLLDIAVFAVVFLVGFWTFHKNGISLKKNTTEIDISEPGYYEALSAWENNDYLAAESKFKDALKSSDSKNGISSLESAEISQKLGALYLDMGQLESAFEHLNSAYVSFKKALGDKDGKTIISLGQIAIYDIKIGNTEKGLSTLTDLYDTAEFLNYKIQICEMLAQCYIELGNYKKAAEWFDILGEFYTKLEIYGNRRVVLLNDYGTFLMTIGNYEEAVKCLSAAVSEWNKLKAKKDNTIVTVYLNLAQAYEWTYQPEKASKAINKALQTGKNLFGEVSLESAMAYAVASHTFKSEEDLSARKKYLDKAYSIATFLVGENHEVTASIYSDMAYYYYDIGNLEQAIEYHKKALEIRKNILGIKSAKTIPIYQDLADDYREAGQYLPGIDCIEKAIELSESIFGRYNPNTAENYIKAAWLYSDNGEYEKALQLATKACKIISRQEETYKRNEPYSYQTMGYVYLNNQDADNAIKYLLKAKELYEETAEYNGRNISNTLVFLSNAYLICKDYSESFKCLYQAEELAKETPFMDKESEIINNNMYKIYEALSPELDYKSWLSKEINDISDKQVR